ncbi:MAG TPA: ferredoxin [Kribbella sp.]|nr:ferredoxin [Amycolatopsis sp.]HWD77777.1 ferredoxin [Kribbella sp.]
MRVRTDLDRCCGNGQCVMDAPEVFDQNDDDGTVIVLQEHPGADQAAAVRNAVKNCPTEAITLVES